jgi:hypothetical protein
MWRLIDTRLNSSEAATIIAAISAHLVAKSIERVSPFAARDLSISPDGDVLIEPRAAASPEPVVEVVVRLLRELVELVDDPHPGLTGYARTAGQSDRSPAAELTRLAAWMEQAFDVRDSRAVLRPLAERMGPSVAHDPVLVAVPADIDWTLFPLEASAPAATTPARAGGRRVRPRTLITVGLMAVGLIVVGLMEGARRHTPAPTPTAVPTAAERARDTSPVSAEPRPAPGDPSRRAPPMDVRPPTTPHATSEAPRDQRITSGPHTVPLNTPGIAAPVFSPSFDSTGSVIFFHVGRSPEAHLAEGRLDNQEQLVEVRALTDDGSRNYHARLSPDGRHVAFDSDRDGERGVYVARRDGSSPRRVSGSGFAAAPTWSPDGGRLAFVRGEPSQRNVWNLWLLHLVSGELERVTSYGHGQLWSASWFPEGTRVCYSHESSLYVVDLESGTRQRFESPVRGRMVRTPAVSPEGRRIVFQVHGDGVWMLHLDTAEMRRILDDATAEEFTWDSRGARVAYHSRRDGQWRIWITAPPLPSDPTP